MKIVITTPHEGGPFTYTKLLEEEMTHRGVTVVVCSFGEVRHMPKLVRHSMFLFKVVRASVGASVLYAQDPVSTGIPTWVAARITGKVFVVRIAGDYAWEQGRQFFGVTDTIEVFQTKSYTGRVKILRRVERFLARHADVVIVPSNYFASIVRGWGAVEPVVIYNGIQHGVIPQEPSLSIAPRTIVSVGRLVPWKGFATVITLLNTLPEWHLIIVGEGEMREELEDLATNIGVGDRVQFTGRLSREEIYGIFQRTDVFVLNTSFESFSFLAVEAMDAGVPVVAGRAGSIPEIIRDGVDGILVEPNNLNELKAAVEHINTDTEFTSNLVASGRKRAQEFSIQKTADMFLRAIQEML